jgi:tripartite-type tricarboxylate transporter receptor subunit TctC
MSKSRYITRRPVLGALAALALAGAMPLAQAQGNFPSKPITFVVPYPAGGANDMLGRLVGLLAHAVDQATDGSPIRARLRYVGPEPGAH